MSVSIQNTINKTIASDIAVNYDAMFKEAILLIGEISGEKWTNYNPSDPGVTMLELLCYALLDMGYKSSFPMKDILSDKDDKILTYNHLYTAREILFSNPVTTNDFRKLIIDRAESVKNVWVNKNEATGSIPESYEVLYELTDELKAKWVNIISSGIIEQNTDDNLNTTSPSDDFKDQIEEITTGIDALLYRHRNLGQVFFKPTVLIPEILTPSGTIYFEKSASVEECLAEVYYQLNNYLSAYIQFYTYPELKEQGMTVGDILQGPRLENGFIIDSDLQERQLEVDIRKLQSLVVNTANVESVFSFNVVQSGNSEVIIPGEVIIGARKSGFFNYFTVSTLINDPGSLFKIYSGEQLVSKVDQGKVNAYYQSLTARKAVSSFNFKNELGPQLPKGQFRNIENYHSVQALFPASYGLQTNHSFEGYSQLKKAQIKQLKAYLMMFEQIIADHQAQMANLDELLSFDSGVGIKEPLCKTYYTQGLYDVPGAEYILKAFDVYKNENAFISEYPDTNWNNFKTDEWNTYSAFLEQSKTTEKNNISRKEKLLSHVYARLGQKYDLEPLKELNPEYGNYDLARVEVVSSMLKNFSVYGENLGRSYFGVEATELNAFEGGELLIELELFSGLEYKFGLLFQLNGYYKGLVDVLSYYLTNEEDRSITTHYESSDIPGGIQNYLVIDYHNEPIIKVAYEGEVVVTPDDVIINYLRTLKRLMAETKGFVLIDNQLLTSNLQNQDWGVLKNNNLLGFKAQTSGKEETKVKHINLRQAQNVINRFKDKWSNDDVNIVYNTKDHNEDVETKDSWPDSFGSSVSLFLLKGICKFDDSDFLNTFLSQFAKEGPVQLNYNLYRVGSADMNVLLNKREVWLNGNYRLQTGRTPEDGFIKAVNSIVTTISNTEMEMSR